MAMKIIVPNLDGIRRIAASLATVTDSAVANQDTSSPTPNINQSVQNYFAIFPWSGFTQRVVRGLPKIETATVGHYFEALDWEGGMIHQTITHTSTEVDEGFKSQSSDLSALDTHKEKSFEKFFDTMFD